MSNPDLQGRVNKLTSRIESDLASVVDDIERTNLRPLMRSMHACVVKCFDKAGTKKRAGSKEEIERCSRECQEPSRRAGEGARMEVEAFQQRLNRAMQTCNEDAQGMVTPDMAEDPKKMKGVENSLVKCIQKAIDRSGEGLAPMRRRIEGHMS